MFWRHHHVRLKHHKQIDWTVAAALVSSHPSTDLIDMSPLGPRDVDWLDIILLPPHCLRYSESLFSYME